MLLVILVKGGLGMKEQMLDQFIKYAKDKFGYDISVDESLAPDSFESIFGGSFLGYESELNISEDGLNRISGNYTNDSLNVPNNFGYGIVEYDVEQELALVA